MSPEDSVNRSELLSGLRSLGLRRGDNVVVHCRLSSFGHIEGLPFLRMIERKVKWIMAHIDELRVPLRA